MLQRSEQTRKPRTGREASRPESPERGRKKRAMSRTRNTNTSTATIGVTDWVALANKAKAEATARATKKDKVAKPRQPSLGARFLADLAQTNPQGIAVPLTGAVALWLSAQPEGTVGGGKTPDASIAAQLYTARKAGTLPARIALDKRGSSTWLVVSPE